jgi:UDP-glucose 4-epimerase
MTTLVTGGAGYIGSHFVHHMHDLGRQVVVIDNLSTGRQGAVPPQVPMVVGDVGDQALVADTIQKYRIRSVIHFAASIVVPASIANPLEYYRNNTSHARSLIEAAVSNGVSRFIFSSTAAVYGNPKANPVRETDTPNPMSPYGTSKWMTELILRDVAIAHDLKYVVLRYFNVAGADPKMRSGQSTKDATHLIKVAVQTALGLRSSMDLFGNDYPTPDGTCIRDYIHVTDLAAAHSAALSYLERGGDSVTLNCGYGRGYSVLQVIDAVKRMSQSDFSFRLRARRAGDPATIVADATKIRSVLAWKPALDDLEQIVTHSLIWEKRLVASQLPT